MYNTIVITGIRYKDAAEQIAYTAKILLSQYSGCPVERPCLACAGRTCLDCVESHIFVLHNGD